MVNTTRNKKGTNEKKRSVLRALSAPVKYIKSKVKIVYKKKTDNEVYNEENLKIKSISKLKEIAKLRSTKNMGKLKKRS